MATALPTVDVITAEPYIVAPLTKRARIKGTWTMYYGADRYDFVDGQYAELAPDLFDYLRSRGNIYDTLA